jgi:hypothetical protein
MTMISDNTILIKLRMLRINTPLLIVVVYIFVIIAPEIIMLKSLCPTLNPISQLLLVLIAVTE